MRTCSKRFLLRRVGNLYEEVLEDTYLAIFRLMSIHTSAHLLRQTPYCSWNNVYLAFSVKRALRRMLDGSGHSRVRAWEGRKEAERSLKFNSGRRTWIGGLSA